MAALIIPEGFEMKGKLIDALKTYLSILREVRWGEFEAIEEQLSQQNEGISLRDPLLLLEGLTEF